MQLISKSNKRIHFLCVIDIFSKYARIILLKKKKALQYLMILKYIQKNLAGKPKKIWVDKGREFYNRSMKSWLERMT